jgi:hypothetical protein
MAKYVVFIYDDEAKLGSSGAETIQSIIEGHKKFAEKHGASLRGGGRLAPGKGAVSLPTGDDGQPGARQEGLFLPGTTENISGYYIIEASDLDNAVEIAGDIPARFGGVEIRELV